MIWNKAERGILRDLFGVGAAVSGGINAAATLSAAHTQADATKYGVDQTSKAAANSLAFNKDVYNQTRANEKPYMAAGASAAGQLQAGLSDGSLTKGYGPQFSFSGVDLKNDPAYQFDLDQGQQAIQRSAAASGGLVSGGALKDLDSYTQGYASNQYQQSYSNALAAYTQAYNQYETTQGNTYNRLAATAGLGQNAVTGTATSGASASGTNAATSANAANTIAGLTTAGASATGAATLSMGNTLAGASNQIFNSLAQKSNSSYGGYGGYGGYSSGGIRDSSGNYIGE